MKTRILIGLFLLAFFCVEHVFAQKTGKETPNFSGTWILDESKSNKALNEVFKSSKKSSDPSKKTIDQFVIEHSGNEIKTAETLSVEIFDERGKLSEKTEKTLPAKIYYTDRRGERNIDEKNQPVDSVTKWKGKQIIVVNRGEKKDQTSTMVFSLSKDGQELRIKYISYKYDDGVVSPSGFGERVFNKTR